MMKEQLIKAMQRNQFLNMMYLAKDGNVSKRRIKIIKIAGNSYKASQCTFMIDSVLAVVPAILIECEVIC